MLCLVKTKSMTAIETVKKFIELYKAQNVNELRKITLSYTHGTPINAFHKFLKGDIHEYQETVISDYISDVYVNNKLRIRLVKDRGIGKPDLNEPYRVNLISFRWK